MITQARSESPHPRTIGWIGTTKGSVFMVTIPLIANPDDPASPSKTMHAITPFICATDAVATAEAADLPNVLLCIEDTNPI